MWQPLFVYITGFLLLLLSYLFRNLRLPIFWILIIALIPRITYLLLFLNVQSFDTLAVASNADLTLKGINIYPEHAQLQYPYFPFFLYLEAFSGFLTKFQIPIMFTIKSAIILFDFGVVFLLHIFDKQRRTNTALLYALAPIPILISSFHGQFDAMPIFFILLALMFMQKGKEVVPLVSVGAAIALKTWPLILVYSFFQKLKNKWGILWLALIPALTVPIYSFFFKATLWGMLPPIFLYSGVQQPLWGISFAIHQLFGEADPILLLTLQQVFLLTFFAYILFFSKRETLEKTILGILLFFFAFTIHSGIQWFLWPIPFLFLVRPKGWLVLYFLLSAFVITHYASWTEQQSLQSPQITLLTARKLFTFGAWAGVLVMFIKNLSIFAYSNKLRG